VNGKRKGNDLKIKGTRKGEEWRVIARGREKSGT
jgi:hypothetical protein